MKTKVNAGKISQIRHMDLVRFWYGPRRGNGQVNATHGEGALTYGAASTLIGASRIFDIITKLLPLQRRVLIYGH